MSNAQKIYTVALPVLWVLVLSITAWLYWPGINGPVMLDDRASVTVLDELDDNPEYALDYILGDIAGPLGRPVSMVSFVVEKLYLNEGILGGKKVNIILHLFHGCLLVWLLVLLLRYLQVPASASLALLAAAAWLLSPLYVSTVLYVVQRMAMLASLFIVLACISYIYCRRAFLKGKSWLAYIFLISVVMFLILAVFSKETGIVGVPVVFLIEALWFQFRDDDGQVLARLRLFVLGSIFAGAAFVSLFFIVGFDWLIGSYSYRGFTLGERVLTESRILWDYLRQLIWPDVTRMGLYHDDTVVSTSLLQPLSTVYAVLAWLCVIALSVVALKWRRGRYAVFCVAVFFIGHSTESTILPLELYYEHRNYFPGIGLFLGIAALLGFLFKKWPELSAPVITWGWFFVLLLAMQTSSQVQIWSSAPLLYINDVNGHPHSFRANANMASQLAAVGALDGALKYSAKAYSYSYDERQGDYDLRDLSLSCTANQVLPAERIAKLGLVDANRPLSSVSTLNVLVRQMQDNECPNFDRLLFADRMVTLFLSDQCCEDQLDGGSFQEKASPNIYAGLAVLENALERYDNAYQYTERFLMGSPGSVRGLLMKLHFATALQKQDEVGSTMAQLLLLEKSGALNLADAQTLALYKDN